MFISKVFESANRLGARRFRVGKIARNWTYQGEVYICLKDDPIPLHITCEEDFPLSTALKEGEGMLLREIPLRGHQTQQNYYNRNPGQYSAPHQTTGENRNQICNPQSSRPVGLHNERAQQMRNHPHSQDTNTELKITPRKQRAPNNNSSNPRVRMPETRIYQLSTRETDIHNYTQEILTSTSHTRIVTVDTQTKEPGRPI